MSLPSEFTLSNGVRIPSIGFGTYKVTDPIQTVFAVKTALQAGYRHIDTAAFYQNEEYVGKALKESGIPRDEVFVTSKVWNTDRGYAKTIASCERSLGKLGLDHLDLFLVHWPAVESQYPGKWKEINADTWRGMERLYADGKVRAIGVSNFMPHHLEPLLESASVLPMADQIEFHPGYNEDEIRRFCQEKGIVVEAYSPLGRGNIMDDPDLCEIAEKHNATVAEVCISWVLSHGVVALPKSVHEERIKSNLKTVELSGEDIARIDSLPTRWWSGHTADEVTF